MNEPSLIEVRRTQVFEDWLVSLRDDLAQARIIKRLDRLALGNFGQWRTLGGGIAELKIDSGPGYRVYYTTRGSVVVLLLCGGDKGSQQRDIRRARELALNVVWED